MNVRLIEQNPKQRNQNPDPIWAPGGTICFLPRVPIEYPMTRFAGHTAFIAEDHGGAAGEVMVAPTHIPPTFVTWNQPLRLCPGTSQIQPAL